MVREGLQNEALSRLLQATCMHDALQVHTDKVVLKSEVLQGGEADHVHAATLLQCECHVNGGV